MVPGWFKSELSADKNTKKVLTSSVSWPHDPARPCRLWPSDDDGDEDDGKDQVFVVFVSAK